MLCRQLQAAKRPAFQALQPGQDYADAATTQRLLYGPERIRIPLWPDNDRVGQRNAQSGRGWRIEIVLGVHDDQHSAEFRDEL
jgi:hypothetical protein